MLWEGTCNQMRRLIRVFAGGTSVIVSFVVRWLMFLVSLGKNMLWVVTDFLPWKYVLATHFNVEIRAQFSCRNQGPVVQSLVSLTSSLRVISLTVLADSIYNILIFFAEKMWVAFALQKLLTFFSAKNSSVFAYHLM